MDEQTKMYDNTCRVADQKERLSVTSKTKTDYAYDYKQSLILLGIIWELLNYTNTQVDWNFYNRLIIN